MVRGFTKGWNIPFVGRRGPSAAGELRPNRATPVFRLPPSLVDYDVVADGSRFLAAVPVSAEHEPALSIVVNWTRWLTERNRPEN